ncbi:hypothetical protein CBR_g49412 [Chara braunii]|uniref:DUF659 domain-containing protein n=1 Tax=Chara braunii TaxID=69332 RepID=A0A388M577_CHABU|nr:hypothetical protein CBR_g49412 [Chara braunii]|eukprot:GBG89622.1 hypothetical protein CBR_g49412 [Chara braunii]
MEVLKEEGPSKRKDGGADPAATQAGKRLRQQKVTEVYGGVWVARHKKVFLQWLYSSRVSFNAFRNEAWKAYQQVLLEQPGSSPRAVLPSHSEIASMQAVETHCAELAEELEEVRQPFRVTGATILSNGKKSRDGRPIVNFLVAGSRGVVMYMTINREGEPDDAEHVLWRWVTIFREFRFGGPQRVNAICIDSASAYVGAAKAMTSPTMPLALRRITWLPCSIHVCNKLLSDMVTSCDAFVDMITRARINWDPWWQRVATIVHIMEPVMQLLRRMDRGGQFMSLMVEWAHDLVHRVKDACAPLGQSFADWIIRRVQTPTHHMLESAHCVGFLLNPRTRHVRYFPGEVEDYHAWLVRQTKRYILTQTGFEFDGADYIVACRQFEDFHMQQGRFGGWGGAEGRARGRACSGDAETTECTSWWSQYGLALLSCNGGDEDSYSDEARVVHSATSCSESCTTIARLATSTGHYNGGDGGVGILLVLARTFAEIYDDSPTEVTITFPGGLAGGGWPQCHSDGQGGTTAAEEEVTTTTTAEGEVATADEEVPAVATGEEVPAGAAVEGEEEVVPAVVVSDVDMEHDGADATGGGHDAEEHLMQQFLMEELDPVVGGFTPGVARGLGMSPHTGWAGSEMGTHFDFDMSMGAPPTCSGTASTDRAPSRDEAAGEMGSQTPRERMAAKSQDTAHDIMERERARLMASSNPRAQAFARALEERRRREIGRDGGQGGVVVGADVMKGVAAKAVDEAMEGGPQAVDEVVENGYGRDGRAGDARPVVHEIVTDLVVPSSGLHLVEARRSQPAEVAVHDVPPVIITDLGSEPMRGRGGGVSTSTLDHALRAATRVVHDQTPRKHGVPRPRSVPVEGGAALGESSGAGGLGMPRGSCRQDTVAQASTRVVLVRKGGSPVTIEEDDPETAPTVREEDEDYEGEEESEEEESESGDSGDDDEDDDEPPPPPPMRASRRSAAQTSSSARGKRRSTSDTRGGTRRQSGKGKRGR